MIPVDLNRLREATESGWTQFENHGDTMVAMPRPRFDEYHQTTRAVLDAPTADVADVSVTRDQGLVQWVVTLVGIGKPPVEFADRVALVPVKGEAV